MFDIWVLNPDPEKGYSPEQELVFKTIYEFIYDRLVYLWNEIEEEENEGEEGKTPCVFVEILKKRIAFKDYSPVLTEKLKGSFNENDSHLLAERLNEAFSHFN